MNDFESITFHQVTNPLERKAWIEAYENLPPDLKQIAIWKSVGLTNRKILDLLKTTDSSIKYHPNKVGEIVLDMYSFLGVNSVDELRELIKKCDLDSYEKMLKFFGYMDIEGIIIDDILSSALVLDSCNVPFSQIALNLGTTEKALRTRFDVLLKNNPGKLDLNKLRAGIFRSFPDKIRAEAESRGSYLINNVLFSQEEMRIMILRVLGVSYREIAMELGKSNDRALDVRVASTIAPKVDKLGQGSMLDVMLKYYPNMVEFELRKRAQMMIGSIILSPRETKAVILACSGDIELVDAATQLNVTYGKYRGILSDIYKKLGVKKLKELHALVSRHYPDLSAVGPTHAQEN